MSDLPTAEAGPEPAGRSFYEARPAPLVAAIGVVVDQRQRMLVLTSTSKDHELPGGLVGDRETPEQALARELAEGLGLHTSVGRLLAVDALPPAHHGRAMVAHLHVVGPLTAEHAGALSPRGGEGGAASWLPVDEAEAALPSRLARQVRAAMTAWLNGGVAHLVDGVVQVGSPSGMSPERRATLEAAHALDFSSFLAGRPKVVVGATVVCTDVGGRVLLVQPTYHADGRWQLPGGCVDSDLDETPREAARRELLEEVGWCPPLGRLLGVNWHTNPPFPVRISYHFDGGTITPQTVDKLAPEPTEIAQVALVDLERTRVVIDPAMHARLSAVVAAQRSGAEGLELHDGLPPTLD